MKIAHEAMNAARPLVDQLTDYDYFLVHLLDENYEYRARALQSNRFSILDNSIFELDEPYDVNKYLPWIKTLEPDIAIVPDALDSKEETLANLESFFQELESAGLGQLSTRYMGVAQGETEEELLECWEALQADSRISIVGVSFNSAPFAQGYSLDAIVTRWVRGRIRFLDQVTDLGTRKIEKPIHLLGVSLPQELRHYRDYYNPGLIHSVDTSSPVLHGYHGVRYAETGLGSKISRKMHELIDKPVDITQKFDIAFNVCAFRRFAKK